MKIRRLDLRDMGIAMLPRPHERLGRRAGHLCSQRRWGVHIGIGPAGDCQHRRLDRRPVFTDRAMFPERIPRLMAQPIRRHKGQIIDPAQPFRAPIRTQFRIQRPGHIGKHLARPVLVIAEQAAPHIVDIVSIAIHGRGHRNHRFQGLRSAVGHLQAIEPAPGNPDHTDLAR